MNRKERRLALRTAFISRSEDLIVVENFAEQLSTPKTKEVIAAFTRLGIEKGQKVLLIVTDPIADNLNLSVRNLPTVKIIKHDCLNIYDILNADYIVATSEAITKIQEVYCGE